MIFLSLLFDKKLKTIVLISNAYTFVFIYYIILFSLSKGLISKSHQISLDKIRRVKHEKE